MGMPSAQVGSPMSQSSGKGSPNNHPDIGISMPRNGGFPAYKPALDQPELGPDVAQTDIKPQPQVIPEMMQPDAGQNGQYQPRGKGGSVSFPGQGGQPRMGQPNNYSNTVGPWDNANIQPRQTQSGKGKGY
jgi:hypothetical protein